MRLTEYKNVLKELLTEYKNVLKELLNNIREVSLLEILVSFLYINLILSIFISVNPKFLYYYLLCFFLYCFLGTILITKDCTYNKNLNSNTISKLIPLRVYLWALYGISCMLSAYVLFTYRKKILNLFDSKIVLTLVLSLTTVWYIFNVKFMGLFCNSTSYIERFKKEFVVLIITFSVILYVTIKYNTKR